MTLRRIGAAVLCALALTATANAKQRHHAQSPRVECFDNSGRHVCPAVEGVTAQISARRGAYSVSTSGLVAPLLAKVNEIRQDCGSVVVSAFRRGARVPTGQISNHARWRAADLRGNPSCIYAHLHGWPGGYSTDYASAPGGPHVHISYNPGGMEWGVRFVHHHGASSYSARRHHHRHRVASR